MTTNHTNINFNDCTLNTLDKLFKLDVIDHHPALQNWLNEIVDLSEFEQQALRLYQKVLRRYVHDWNEIELLQHFIGPMFTLVDFSSKKIGLFSERFLQGTVDGITLRGYPDGIVARGFREPEQPYFCFQEYKKQRDPNGDPAGQALAAMIVGQLLNQQSHPLYGCYVVGYNWQFMVLHNKEYSISEPFTATNDDIFEIFRILKALKLIVLKLVDADEQENKRGTSIQ